MATEQQVQIVDDRCDDSPSDSGRESTTSSPDAVITSSIGSIVPTTTLAVAVSNDADKQFKVKIIAPNADPFELLVNGGELVQELHQVLLDRESTCNRTCFTLQLNGQALDHFTEWKNVEGMHDNASLKVVEEAYTLREARIHLRHIRDLLRSLDAADAYNGVDGNSLSYAATVCYNTTTQETVMASDTGVAASAGIQAATLVDKTDRRTRQSQSVAEKSSMDCTPPEYALPGYKERPLAPLHPLNKELVSANVRCIKSLAPSLWNPPPANRRLRGDVMYFVAHILEDRRYHITCCTRGFYVNQSTDDSFNPRPDGNPKLYHSLIDLLSHLSPSFKRNFVHMQKRRAQRQIFERLPTPYQTFFWTVPPSDNTTDYIRAEDGTQSHRLGLEDHIPGQTRDWNEELQTTRELPRGTLQERVIRERAIFKIHSDFVSAAVRGAQAVVDGNVMAINPADEPRTHMYIWNNIFFSLGFDVKDHYKPLGGDAAAFVAPSNDLQGVRAFAQLDNEKLFTLGMVIIDYRGYRVTAQSIIPGILEREQEQSVVYGSIDFGTTICSTPEYENLLKESAIALKILPHKVKSKPKEPEKEKTIVKLFSSFEAKGIIGNDSRHYVLDLLRTSPPDIHYLPDAKQMEENEPLVALVSAANGYPRKLPHKLACLRQELVDAFVEHRYHTFLRIAAYYLQHIQQNKKKEDNKDEKKSKDDEKEAGRIAAQVRAKLMAQDECEECPGDAASLDQSEAKRILESTKEIKESVQEKEEPDTKTNQQTGVIDPNKLTTRAEIVAYAARLAGSQETDDFVLRFNPDCYCDTVEHAEDEADLLAQRRLVREAAQFLLTNQLPAAVRDCIEQPPLDGQGLIDQMHARGVNVRYLGKLADCVAGESTLDYLHTIAVNELIARAVKHLMRPYLQSVPAAHIAAAIAHFLNCLLSSSSGGPPPPQVPNYLHEDRNQRNDTSRTNKKLFGNRRNPDTDWTHLSATQLWQRISSDIDSYYAFELNCTGMEAVTSRYNVSKISLLRRVCQINGIQILSRDYQLDMNVRPRLLTEEDILLLTPVVKHINPRANDATQYYHAGQAKIQQGHLRTGYELILESLNLLNGVYGAMHQEIAQCMHMLARLAYILNDSQEAQTYQLKAVQMCERCSGIDAAITIHEYATLAHYAFANLQVSTALRLLYRARYLLLVVVGNEQHPFLATIDANIGIMLYAVQEFDAALKYLESAHRLHTHYHGKKTLKTAMLCHLIARAHSCRGDFRTALQHEKVTYHIYRQLLGDSHDKTRDSSECLRHLTEQAVSFQKKMNEASRSDERSSKLPLGQLLPLPFHQPTVSSIIDMLNIFNGIVYFQLSPQKKDEDKENE